MKLDFEETENKIEIEKAELLKKNKEQDMVINSQAIIAKELRDEVKNLKEEKKDLKEEIEELNERVLELESINSALHDIEFYKKRIEECFQENFEILEDNKKIQNELNISVKQVSSEINKQIREVNSQIKKTIDNSTSSFGNMLLRSDYLYWILIIIFILTTGFFVKYLFGTNERLRDTNFYLEEMDEIMKHQKFYWYDEKNGTVYFKTKKEMEKQNKKK